MTTPPGKVGEIFTHAGLAFSKLGEMTAQIDAVDSSGKWTEEEIEMLRAAVSKFSEEIGNISQIIKLRTLSQTKDAMKNKLIGGNTTGATSSSSSVVPLGGMQPPPATTVISGIPLSAVSHINPASSISVSPSFPLPPLPQPHPHPKQVIQRVYVTPASNVLQKTDNITLSALNSQVDTDLDVEAMNAANKIQSMW